MNIKYILWFLLRGIVSYPIFYIGLTLINIFIMFFYDIKDNLGNYGLFSMIIIILIGIIYNFTFYTRDSKKIGIITIYGGDIISGFLIPFIEILTFMIIAIFIILITIGYISFTAIAIGFGFTLLTSIIIAIRFIFTDIYKIIKEN
ncbi:MAG TPA: hypothetical protein PKW55_07130 [Spirochaetota bacterium]|nr:hypothetical protein [Spirochaetota bacterium]HOM38711.1 hypothetical protein [Spirochaetota bacterium]HPQ49508.1 hypothetical protein [Spirochaetota bacterium]